MSLSQSTHDSITMFYPWFDPPQIVISTRSIHYSTLFDSWFEPIQPMIRFRSTQYGTFDQSVLKKKNEVSNLPPKTNWQIQALKPAWTMLKSKRLKENFLLLIKWTNSLLNWIRMRLFTWSERTLFDPWFYHIRPWFDTVRRYRPI